jgi:hypothetical protein
LAAIDAAAKSLEFLVKPLDAKAERVALQKSKDELIQELKLCGSSDTSKTLILGTCLAVATYTRCLFIYFLHYAIFFHIRNSSAAV